VQNFSVFFLHISLSTHCKPHSTVLVDIFLLILNQISSLSTHPYFGAKLISLYLFQEKKGGKVMYKRVNYSFYSHIGDGQNENLRIIHTLSTGFPHSYQHL
jgi:hypothetical protein